MINSASSDFASNGTLLHQDGDRNPSEGGFGATNTNPSVSKPVLPTISGGCTSIDEDNNLSINPIQTSTDLSKPNIYTETYPYNDPPMYTAIDSKFITESYSEPSNDDNNKVPETPDSPPLKNSSDTQQKMPVSRIRQTLKMLSLEFYTFLKTISFSMILTPLQDLYMRKACLNELHYNNTICSNIDDYSHEKDEIEKIANTYSMYHKLAMTGLSFFVVFSVGPWADKYGTKVPFIFTNMASIITTLINMYTVYDMSTPLYVNIFGSVIIGLAGGFLTFMVCMYTMVAKTCKDAPSRRRKYFSVNIVRQLASAASMFASGQIYKHFGMNYVLLICLCMDCVSQMWILFFMSDGDDNEGNMVSPEQPESYKEKFRMLFRWRNLTESFRVCFRRRPNNRRTQLLCMLGVNVVIMLSFTGAIGEGFYFVRKMYNWQVDKYTTVHAISTGVNSFLTIPITFLFTKVIRISDPATSALGAFFCTIRSIVHGLAYQEWMYYIQMSMGALSFILMVGLQSHISSLVDTHETGKVFTVFSIFENGMPMLGGILFTQIFNWSVSFMPGLVFLVAGVMYGTTIIPLLYCAKMTRTSYSPLTDEVQTKDQQKDEVKV